MASPLDSLLSMPGPAGDVQRDFVASAPQPNETPSMTAGRNYQESQQKARVQRYRAEDLAKRDIPTYTDPSGNVDAVRDETGAALTQLDRRHGIAYDSTGAPRKLVYGETGAPKTVDPFAGVGITTDEKTGFRYRITPGLAWQNVDQDPDIAARNVRKEQAKAVAQEAALNDSVKRADSAVLRDALSEHKKTDKALAYAYRTEPTDDLPAVKAKIKSAFDAETKANSASMFRFAGFGSTDQEIAAKQAEIDARHAAEQAKADRLFKLRREIPVLQQKTAAERQKAQELAYARQTLANGGTPAPAQPQNQPAPAPQDGQGAALTTPQDVPAQEGTPQPENGQNETNSQQEAENGQLQAASPTETPLGPDNGVGPVANFIGSSMGQVATTRDTMAEAAARLGSAATGAVGLKAASEWLKKAAGEQKQDRLWLAELKTGQVSPENPYRQSGPKAGLNVTYNPLENPFMPTVVPGADYVNPSRQEDLSSGIARGIPMASQMLVPGRAGLAMMGAMGAAEGGIAANDVGGNVPWEAAKAAGIAAGTMALFHGANKLAVKLVPEMLSPWKRFAANAASATAFNAATDATVHYLLGQNVIPKNLAEWGERGLFITGIAAMHGHGEMGMPARIKGAYDQLAINRDARDKAEASGQADTVAAIDANNATLHQFLDSREGLEQKMQNAGQVPLRETVDQYSGKAEEETGEKPGGPDESEGDENGGTAQHDEPPPTAPGGAPGARSTSNPTPTASEGYRHSESPETKDYHENGGWKLHLAVDPANYEAVDKWLDSNHRGLYKLLNGGDPGESDFTVYVGGKDEAAALASKIDAEIGGELLPPQSSGPGADTQFGAKVTGRFDPRGKNSWGSGGTNYGRDGLPYDDATRDAAEQVRLATKSGDAEHAKLWAEIRDRHEQRIASELTAKYGKRFTGKTPSVQGQETPSGHEQSSPDASDAKESLPAPKASILPEKEIQQGQGSPAQKATTPTPEVQPHLDGAVPGETPATPTSAPVAEPPTSEAPRSSPQESSSRDQSSGNPTPAEAPSSPENAVGDAVTDDTVGKSKKGQSKEGQGKSQIPATGTSGTSSSPDPTPGAEPAQSGTLAKSATVPEPTLAAPSQEPARPNTPAPAAGRGLTDNGKSGTVTKPESPAGETAFPMRSGSDAADVNAQPSTTPKGRDGYGKSDFLEKLKTPMHRAKADAALSQRVRYNGTEMTRAEMVESAVAGGAKIETQEFANEAATKEAQKQYDRLRKTAPTGNENHPDTIRLRELKRTLDAGGVKKKERFLQKPDGSFLSESTVSKTGMDYAERLLQSATSQESEVTYEPSKPQQNAPGKGNPPSQQPGRQAGTPDGGADQAARGKPGGAVLSPDEALTHAQAFGKERGVTITEGATTGDSGLEAKSGKVFVDKEKLAATLERVRAFQKKNGVDSTPSEWMKAAIEEEHIHVGQSMLPGGEKGFYTAFPDEHMPKGWEEKVREARGDTDKEPWQRKAEFVRMVLQGDVKGMTITEAFWNHLRHVVNYLKGISKRDGTTEFFRQHLAEVERNLEALRPKEAKREPLNMAGKTRAEMSSKKEPAPTPGFDALHPKSKEKFTAAFEARDGDAMKALLHLGNKGLRAEFEKRVGKQLPKTESGTKMAIGSWAKGNLDKSYALHPASPFEEPASPAPPESAKAGTAEEKPLPPLFESERSRAPLIERYRKALEDVTEKLKDEDRPNFEKLKETRGKIVTKLRELEQQAAPNAKLETAEERVKSETPMSPEEKRGRQRAANAEATAKAEADAKPAAEQIETITAAAKERKAAERMAKAPDTSPKKMKVQKEFLLSALDKAHEEATVEKTPEFATEVGSKDAKTVSDFQQYDSDIQAEKPRVSGYAMSANEKAELAEKMGAWEAKATAQLRDLFDQYGIPLEAAPEQGYLASDGSRHLVREGGPLNLSDRTTLLSTAIRELDAISHPRIEIEVPGDGTFRIINTKEAIGKFREIAKKRFPTRAPAPDRGASTMRATPTAIPPIGKPKSAADFVKIGDPIRSQDGTRFVINHVHSDGKNIVATDGRRMLVIEGNAGGTEKKPVLFDPKTMKTVTKDADGDEMKFPNWKQVLPSDATEEIRKVDTGALMKLIIQAKEVVTEKSNSFRLWKDEKGKIGVTASGPEVGEYRGGEADWNTAKPIASFNPDFMLDGLRAARQLGHETVTLKHSDEMGTAQITAPGMKYVIMPMRLSAASPVERGTLAAASPISESDRPKYEALAKFRLKETEPTKPVEPTPKERADIERSYRELAKDYPAAPIADVLEGAGFKLTEMHRGRGIVAQMFQKGEITSLASGDWSLSDARKQAWSVRNGDEKAILMRIGEGDTARDADSAPKGSRLAPGYYDEGRDTKVADFARPADPNRPRPGKAQGKLTEFFPSKGRTAGFSPSDKAVRDALKGETETVPLSKIELPGDNHGPLQAEYDKGIAEHYRDNPAKAPVILLESKGSFFPLEGNHRLVGAKMRGDETVDAVVMRKGKPASADASKSSSQEAFALPDYFVKPEKVEGGYRVGSSHWKAFVPASSEPEMTQKVHEWTKYTEKHGAVPLEQFLNRPPAGVPKTWRSTSEKTESGRTVFRVPLKELGSQSVSYSIDAELDKLDPVIIGDDGDVVDGWHRIAMAKERGDKTIRAIYASESDFETADKFGGLKGRGTNSEEAWIEWMHRGGKHPESRAPSEKREGGTLAAASPPDTTSIKNAQTDVDRVAMALREVIPHTARPFPQVEAEARERMAKKPKDAELLIEELARHPRSIDDTESAMLAIKWNEAKKALDDYSEEVNDAADAGDEPARLRAMTKRTLQYYDTQEMADVLKRVGTFNGQALNARKMFNLSNWTREGMMAAERAAHGGKGVDDEMIAKVEADYKRVKEMEAANEAGVKKAWQAQSAEAADDAVKGAKAEVEQEDREWKIEFEKAQAEPPLKVSAKASKRVQAEREALLEELREMQSAGLAAASPPDENAAKPNRLMEIYAGVGAAHLGAGVTKFSEWKAAMVKDLGEKVTPHLDRLWLASRTRLAEVNAEENAATPAAGATPKAPSKPRGPSKEQTPADIAAKMKARLADAEDKRGQMAKLRPYVLKMVKAFIRQGITGTKEVVDAVHGELKKLDPSMTRDRANDFVGGFGDFKPLSKEAVDVRARQIKAETLEQAKINAVKKKQPLLKTGGERQAKNQATRQLTKELNEAKKEFGVVQADPEASLKSVQDSIVTRLTNEMEDVQQEIDLGKRRSRTPVDDNDERIPPLRAQLKDLRARRDAILGKPEMTEAQKVKAALKATRKSLEEYTRRIKEHDFSTREGSRLDDPELNLVRAQRAAAVAEFNELRALDEHYQAKVEGEKIEVVKAKIAELDKKLQTVDPEKGTVDSQPDAPVPKEISTERDALIAERKAMQAALDAARAESPEGQERALLAWKRRTAQKTVELKARVAAGDFSKAARRAAFTPDREALESAAELEKVKQQILQGREKVRLANRPLSHKALDGFAKWSRAIVLSGPITLFKLTSSAAEIMGITPVQELIGGAIGKVIPGIASRAPREGGFSMEAEMKAVTETFNNLWADVSGRGPGRSFGKMDIDYKYGKPDLHPPEVKDFFGRIHSALKTAARRNEFARSYVHFMKREVLAGNDPKDPVVEARVGMAAYEEAQKAIFMNKNAVVDMFKWALKRLQMPDKEGGSIHPSLTNKVLESLIKSEFPIIRIPTNIVARAFQYAVGSVTGVYGAGEAYVKGIENLKPEQADRIMQNLKRGSIGLALLLYGFYHRKEIGGYYERNDKRGPNEPKFGEVKAGGVNIPKFLVHHPALEAMQIGATVGRVMEKHAKKTGETWGPALEGAWAGALGLLEETPFIGTTMRDVRDSSSGTEFFGEHARNKIPVGVQQVAAWTDRKNGQPVKRTPHSFTDHLKMGIPGLRQEVKEKPRAGANFSFFQ